MSDHECNKTAGDSTLETEPHVQGDSRDSSEKLKISRRDALVGLGAVVTLTALVGTTRGCSDKKDTPTPSALEQPAATETTSDTPTPVETAPVISLEEKLHLYDLTQKLSPNVQTAYKELLDKEPSPFITAYDSPRAGAEYYLEKTLSAYYLDNEQGRHELTESILALYPMMTQPDVESTLTNAKREPNALDKTYGLYQIIDRDATVCAMARHIVETYRDTDHSTEAVSIATKLLYAHFLSDDERTQNSGIGNYREFLIDGIQSTISNWRVGSIASTDFEKKFAQPTTVRGKQNIEPIGEVRVAFDPRFYPGENEAWSDKYPSILFPCSIQLTPSSFQDTSPKHVIDNGMNDTPSKKTVETNAAHIFVTRRVENEKGELVLIQRAIPYNPDDMKLTEDMSYPGVDIPRLW